MFFFFSLCAVVSGRVTVFLSVFSLCVSVSGGDVWSRSGMGETEGRDQIGAMAKLGHKPPDTERQYLVTVRSNNNNMTR